MDPNYGYGTGVRVGGHNVQGRAGPTVNGQYGDGSDEGEQRDEIGKIRMDKDPMEPLLPPGAVGAEQNRQQDQSEDSRSGCFYKIQRCMGWTVSKEKREIQFTGRTIPRSFPSNKLNNQKYTLLTFLPLLFWNEFKFFFNMFFLVIALTQFIPSLKVGLLVTYVAPICVFFTITMFKEGFDDLSRMSRDKELNNYIYYRACTEKEKQKNRNKLSKDGQLMQVKSKDIQVGMIIRINHNERLPADMVLLKTAEEQSSIFLRTDQLDGETDWKPKKPIPWTQALAGPDELLTSGGNVQAEPPSEAIYSFKANSFQPSDNSKGGTVSALGPDNTMWQNTVLASHGYVYGLVIYTGKETRSNMSQKKPRSKAGSIDLQINYLSKVLFILMASISAMIIIIDGLQGAFYYKFFRCILLLSAIIPISMRISMDFAKMFYSWQISHDKNIKGAVARSSTIPEELGRIQVLLSDKTGTLTQNDMLFKRLTLEYCHFSDENKQDIRKLLNRGMRHYYKDRAKQENKNQQNWLSVNQPGDGKHNLGSINADDQNYYTSAYEDAEMSAAENPPDYLQFKNEQTGNKQSMNSGNTGAKLTTGDTDAGRKGKLDYGSDFPQADAKKASLQRRRGQHGGAKKPPKSKKKARKRGQHRVVADLFLALSLCHNVTPVITEEEPQDSEVMLQEPVQGDQDPQSPDNDESKKKEENRVFQASSPDEIALVKFAEEMGMRLENRTDDSVVIKDPRGELMHYDILDNFPFSSETKRMGIIVKNQSEDKIMFYMKGAEVVMERKVRPDQRVSLTEACEQLAQDGLRTLVICQKSLTNEEYTSFKVKYDSAMTNMEEDSEKLINNAMESIEDGMEFLAVTGVEDKLQDHVLETIEKFRAAGIQVWMLTGDKIETAKCIAIATGMNRKTESVYEIKGERLQHENELNSLISEYEKMNKNSTMLMVDGVALTKIMKNEFVTKQFFQAAQGAKSVCVCRCSPTQKAFVAKSVKTINNKRIACVGDGGNDVAMIQEADVGLGIVGKEGMQAALASDFSILEFSHLKDLILWHGRLSYQRTAKLSQFIIHRGMIISFIQAIFTMIFFLVTIPIFNGYLILGYATIYTQMPVFSLVFDEDVDRGTALAFPILYQTLQAGRSLNIKTFLIWVWKSVYQASIIMFLAIILFNDSFVTIVSITYTTLIFIEFLNVLQELTHIKKINIFSIIFSSVIYVSSIYVFNNLFQVKLFSNKLFFLKVFGITMASWMPLWMLRKFADWYDPNAVMKVRKTER